jgi:NAD(P)-dependent dehydrogenase (short-subunit alcohol dehydrogenase family)
MLSYVYILFKPMQGAVDPADIAALALFLAGAHARTISGQSFPIDGDSKSSQ